ncbi:MAG TPA: hypothetical protein VMV10_16090 [Pirellulales bacterium]|nr:hypothetical protein [Pirellulales bacterium]
MPDDFGRLATRATIDLALVAYFAGAMLELRSRRREANVDGPAFRLGRTVWTLGCALYLAHVACAFQFYHHWSHQAAYAETARRTAALFGWNSGAGLYFNYAFTLAWLADVVWQQAAPASWRSRPRWLSRLWHGFFLFMVVNATLVFETGPVRWAGVAGCVALVAAWIGSRRKKTIEPAPPVREDSP